jgi:hypothetical protein
MRYKQVITIAVVLIIILAVFYNVVRDEPFFVGEIWGDLSSTGEVVGIHVLESGRIAMSSRGPIGSDTRLMIEVSNISSVLMWYWEDGKIHETNYVLQNRSLTIDASHTGFFGTNDLVNAKIDYHFSEFSGYWVDEFTYHVHLEFESIEGLAQMPHDLDDDGDFTVNWDTYVYIDDVTITDEWASFNIPEDEVADISLTGNGNLSFNTPPEVHIDGTLTIEDFEARKGHQIIPRRYAWVRIEGEDIIVRTRANPDYQNFKGSEYWDPWVIEIESPEGTDVEIRSRLTATNLLVYIFIMGTVIIFLYSLVSHRRTNPPEPTMLEPGHPPRARGR